jgi:hypothetical protein
MAETLMTSSEAIHAFKSLLGIDRETFSEDIPAKTRTQLETLGHLFAQGAGNIGRTRWDAFNAVTEFVDHFRSIRVSSGRNRSEVRFESVLTGSGDDLKARAFDLLAV